MVAKANKHGLRRRILAPVKRQVRQECGYGCVLCGSAIYHYDHFDPPFEDARAHVPSGIALLCGGCHDRKTRGYLAISTVAAARLRPFCRRTGFSHLPIDLGTDEITVSIGALQIIGVEKLIEINGQTILRVQPPESAGAPCRLSARFFDRNGTEVARIDQNEWLGSIKAWDIEARGGRMEIRSQRYALDLSLVVQGPQFLALDRLNLFYDGVSVIVDAEGVRVSAGDATFRVPPDIPVIRHAPVFLVVKGEKISVGSDWVIGLSDPSGLEMLLPGTVDTVGGAQVEFVDPRKDGVPLAGGLPGGKVLRITAGGDGDGVELTFNVPAASGRHRLMAAGPHPTTHEPGRNDPCPCGRGLKYKKCHGRPGVVSNPL